MCELMHANPNARLISMCPSVSLMDPVILYLHQVFSSRNKNSRNCRLQRISAIYIIKWVFAYAFINLVGSISFGVLFNGSWTFYLAKFTFHLMLWKRQILLAHLCIFLSFILRICFIQRSVWEAEKASHAVPRGAEHSCLPHGRSAYLKDQELLACWIWGCCLWW